jgi:hypothetical protein
MEAAKQIVEQDERLAGKKQVVKVFFTDVRNSSPRCAEDWHRKTPSCA